MILNEGSNQGLLFESNSGDGFEPRVCPWPERGVSFAFWLDLSSTNPAMSTDYPYRRREILKNGFVEFVARDCVVASRSIRHERSMVSLTDAEMAGYWPLMRPLSEEDRSKIEYAQIRVWVPKDQRVFIYGDYLKWSLANLVS